MIASRSTRKFAICLMVLGLLFSQFAVLAYACPGESASMSAASGDDMTMVPALCVAHCQPTDNTVNNHPAPDAPAFVASFMAYTLSPILPSPPSATSWVAHAAPATTHAPPVHILNCVFRI